VAFVCASPPGGPPVAAATPAGQAAREVPTFQVDPSWPQLPDTWVLGPVSDVHVDAQDHIWVLHRPRTLSEQERAKAAPPLLEFDASGKLIQAWGGPDKGHPWPATEHGLFVDHNDYVWLGGSGRNDHQVFKFTRTGSFVMQIGRSGESKGNTDTRNVNRAGDVWVDARTNELYVGDGYGNRRVIVFDAGTGAFRRMWGAFGRPPTDPGPGEQVGREEMVEIVRLKSQGSTVPQIAEATGLTATVVEEVLAIGRPDGASPRHFTEAHCARVSRDGFVYVCDGPGKRLQVFTTDGTFVAEAFVNRTIAPRSTATGTAFGRPLEEIEDELSDHHETVGRLTFSGDPEQRFLYVIDRSRQKIVVLDRKSLEALGTFGGGPGDAPGQFYVLHGITSDSRGNVYTAEVNNGGNRRAQKFVLTGTTPATR
jgi:DNA-binding beta-propeller fold protein YncE